MLGAKKPTHKIAVFNKNEEEFVFLGLKLYLMLSLARTKTWVCDLVKGQGGGFTHLKPGSTFVEIFSTNFERSCLSTFEAMCFGHSQNKRRQCFLCYIDVPADMRSAF